ncbi:MAG: coproporphyrinogen III oxidase, partial [Bacilli bacterium]
MNIYFTGEGVQFLRPLTHVAKLYFEQVTIHTEQTEDATLTICMARINETTLSGRLTVGDITYETISTIHSQKDTKRALRNAVLYAVVQLLTEHTGIVQPWGILTGVRPTKLMHGFLRDGLTEESAIHILRTQYGVSEEKAKLLARIVKVQLQTVPDLYTCAKEVSLYIGIPYCPTKCAYCTFPAYAILPNKKNVPRFLAALHEEVIAMGAVLKQKGIRISSIYYGGGTPTSISAEEMDALYTLVETSMPMEGVREVTVEAGRPDTITEEKLAVLRKHGIDRISVNPQSFTDATLKAIGRHHTVQETIDKFHLARQGGMDNINTDLIVGLPGEDLAHLAHSLSETEKLMPESVTVHTLSFKRASEMTRDKDRFPVASREEVSRMVHRATEWMNEHGYAPYYLYRQKNILGNLENVGYSKPGRESVYNIMIMEEAQSIIGIGCGASSKFVSPTTGEIEHYYNPKDPKVYDETYR